MVHRARECWRCAITIGDMWCGISGSGEVGGKELLFIGCTCHGLGTGFWKQMLMHARWRWRSGGCLFCESIRSLSVDG